MLAAVAGHQRRRRAGPPTAAASLDVSVVSRPVVAVVGRGYYGSVEISRRSGESYGRVINLGRLGPIAPGVLTSTILGDPAAVQTTTGIEVFVRGTDNRRRGLVEHPRGLRIRGNLPDVLKAAFGHGRLRAARFARRARLPTPMTTSPEHNDRSRNDGR